MRHSIAAWLPLSFAVLTSSAVAQVAEFGVTGGATRLSNRDLGALSTAASARSDELQLSDGWRLGFRITLNNWRFFGHEFGYAYNRTQLRFNTPPVQEFGMAVHQGFYNFLAYALPEGSPVRPFAAGGGHFSNYTPPGTSASYGGGETKFGFNYGGGMKVRVSPLFLIRLDLRQYFTGKPFDLPKQEGLLRLTEISAGLSLAL